MKKVIIPVVFLIAGLTLAVLSVNAGTPEEQISGFKGRCLTYSPGDVTQCAEQPQICDQYVAAIQGGFNGQTDCIEACENIYGEVYQAKAAGPCGDMVAFGRDECKNYCREFFH